MNDAEWLAAVELRTPPTDDLGQRLLRIHHSILSGAMRMAEEAIAEALPLLSLDEGEWHLTLALGAALLCKQTAPVCDYLLARYGSTCRFMFCLDVPLSRHYLMLFTKVSKNTVEFGFPGTLLGQQGFVGSLRWLVRLLPIFIRSGASDLVPPGSSIVNLWDAGLVSGLAVSAAGTLFQLIPDDAFVPRRGYENLRRGLAADSIPWGDRKTIAFWRGSSTGQVLNKEIGWPSIQRIQLCLLARSHPELIDAGLSDVVQYLVVKKDKIQELGLIKGRFPAGQLQQFKFQIDVDGNSNAFSGFVERLSTGSPVLKIASGKGYKQWYYDRLQPWFHYVPVHADMSDLAEKIVWLKENDDAAQSIGTNGRNFVLSLNYEDELDAALPSIVASFNAFSARQIRRKVMDFQDSGQLKTFHGSTLVFNRDSGFLEHCKLTRTICEDEVVPIQLDRTGDTAVLRASLHGWIAHITMDGKPEFSRLPVTSLNAGVAICEVEMESLGLAFKVNGKYMCAEPNGSISMDRSTRSIWELFYTPQAQSDTLRV